MPNQLFRILFLLTTISSLLFSCKPVEKISAERIRPMNIGRLIKKVEENSFDFENLTIKRISCLFEKENKKTSFKADLKSINSEQIVLSFSKLGVAVGRLLMTPDSLKYINYVDKNYFIDDYSYISQMFDIDLDFDIVESILSNSIFSYRNDPKEKDFRNFNSYIDSGHYVIQSFKERKLRKIDKKDKSKKIGRLLKRMNEESFIVQSVYIEPFSYNPKKLTIEDKSNDRYVEILFDDYTTVDGSDFPGEIDMTFSSIKGLVKMRARMSGFSTSPIKTSSFNIPKKYQKIEIN